MTRAEEIQAELLQRYPALQACAAEIQAAFELLVACYERDGILYVCGNGGSCADADHITGELLKGFRLPRRLPEPECARLRALSAEDGAWLAGKLQRGLRAVSLHSHQALLTAVGNDLGEALGPAQMLQACGRPGDLFWGISTSGNARNLQLAALVARAQNLPVLGLTGRSGGLLARQATVCIRVPEDETFKVQELHLPVYHALCAMLESRFCN